MAAVEFSSVKPPTPSRLQSNISDTAVLSADQCIEKATEKLLFKDFNECIRLCEAGITEAQMQPDTVSHSVQIKLEALCILAVQAYAELNQWQQVMPFVQQVFGSVEDCPYKVMHLCILLHSKIKEYTQCYALSSVWLKHPGNIGSQLITYYSTLHTPKTEGNTSSNFSRLSGIGRNLINALKSFLWPGSSS
ncbi:peroxisome assembly protein 26-like [Ylistrum balloti]|uniref:peroxisome assembly protein 26-like n=1 Tax=Ylistrum balloti TaxID=509963 RepID=UPI002905DFA1|nr:peroxisome assembly protein 26-like [Ylistrum balloti]